MDELTNIKFDLFLIEQDISRNAATGKAIFIVGGPGSGKDFFIRNIHEKYNFIECNLQKLYDYYNGSSDDKIVEMFKRNVGIIVNSTGDTLTTTKKTKVMLEGLGYDTMMVYVHVDQETSQIRTSNRKKVLSEEVLVKRLNTLAEMKPWYERLFANFTEVDNSQDLMLSEESDLVSGMMEDIDKFISEEVCIKISGTTPEEVLKVMGGLKTNDVEIEEHEPAMEPEETPNAFLTLGKPMEKIEIPTGVTYITNADVEKILHKEKFTDKLRGMIESIDCGIEPGNSMTASGENLSRKLSKKETSKSIEPGEGKE